MKDSEFDDEKDDCLAALDDAIDAGLLDDDTPGFEGEPFDIVGLLDRKKRGAQSGRLTNHGLGAAETTRRIREHNEGHRTGTDNADQ